MSITDISFEQLDTAISRLASKSDISIDQLSVQDYKALQDLKLGVSVLFDTQHFEEIPELIKKHPKPQSLKSGTVGFYLFGEEGELYEDPAQAPILSLLGEKFESDKWIPQDSKRKYQIFVIKRDDDGNKCYARVSSRYWADAYVYLQLNLSEQFTGFDPDDIKIFRQYGIKRVQVMNCESSCHSAMTPLLPLEELQYSQLSDQLSTEVRETETITSKGTNNSSAILIIAFLLTIIFLLIRKPFSK